MLCLKTIKTVMSKIKFSTVSWLADQEVLYFLELVMCKQKDQKQYEHCINYKPLRRKTKNTEVTKMYETAGGGDLKEWDWNDNKRDRERAIPGKRNTEKKIENASDIQSSFPLRTFNRCQCRVRIYITHTFQAARFATILRCSSLSAHEPYKLYITQSNNLIIISNNKNIG